jgi:hypothetical protein
MLPNVLNGNTEGMSFQKLLGRFIVFFVSVSFVISCQSAHARIDKAKNPPSPRIWSLPEPFVSNLDATVAFSPSQVAFISGLKILIQDLNTDQYDVYDLAMTTNWPQGISWVDAAMKWSEFELALLSGEKLLIYNTAQSAITSVTDWGVPSGWPQYDGAEVLDGVNFMLLYGLEYVLFEPRLNQFKQGGGINWDPWPGHWSGDVDDLLNIDDGYLYLFRDGEVLVMDVQTRDYVGLGSVNVIQEFQSQQPQYQESAQVQQSTPGDGWCLIGGAGNLSPRKSPIAGVNNGTSFLDVLPKGTRIAEIRVWGMSTISGIQLVTESPEGFRSEAPVAGKGFGKPKVFELVPDECIEGITGATGGPAGNFLYSIQFITNKRTSPLFGPNFGAKGRDSFSFRVPTGSSFLGLFGTYTASLTSIGMQYGVDTSAELAAGAPGAGAAQSTSAYFQGGGQATSTEQEDPYFDQFTDFIDEKAWSVGDYQEKEIPAKDWLGVGIDVLKFDPLEITKSDLPPKSRSIVLLTPSREVCGPKSQWFKPYGARDKSVQSGEEDSKTTISKTFGEFSDEFSVNAHVSVGTPFGGGSLSGSFSEMNSSSFGSEFICASREVVREYYQMELKYDWLDERTGQKQRQQLGYTFRKSVEELPAPSGKMREIDPNTQARGKKLASSLERYRQDYMDFIKKYGTHWAYKVMFGGKYTVIEQVSRTEFENSRKTAMEFQASVNVQVKAVSAGAGGGYGSESSSTRGSSDEKRIRKVKVSGGEGNTDFDQWSAAIASSPGPFDVEVKLISDFLTPVFFPFDEEISNKQILLKAFTYQYLLDNADLPVRPNGDFFRDVAARDCYYKVEISGINTSGHNAELYGNLSIGAWTEGGSQVLNQQFWSKGGGKRTNVLNVGQNSQPIGGIYYIKGKEGDLDRGNVAIWGRLKEYNSVDMGPANRDWDAGVADEDYGSKTSNTVNKFELFSLQGEGQSGDYTVTFGGPPGSIFIKAKITRIPKSQYK